MGDNAPKTIPETIPYIVHEDSMGRYSSRGPYGPYGGSYGRPYFGGGSYDDGMMMEEM